MLEAVATALLPVRVAGDEVITDVTAFVDGATAEEFVAVVFGGPAAAIEEPVLVRIHSGCVTGDILGSLRCDCGDQLTYSIEQIVRRGGGVVIYAPSHEGRGIGLANKIRAYALQDEGLDTIDANTALGFAVDHRSFGQAAEVLRLLGIERVELLTNNPVKVASLRDSGLEVDQVNLPNFSNRYNAGYLATKRDRLGHHAGEATSERVALAPSQLR